MLAACVGSSAFFFQELLQYALAYSNIILLFLVLLYWKKKTFKWFHSLPGSSCWGEDGAQYSTVQCGYCGFPGVGKVHWWTYIYCIYIYCYFYEYLELILGILFQWAAVYTFIKTLIAVARVFSHLHRCDDDALKWIHWGSWTHHQHINSRPATKTRVKEQLCDVSCLNTLNINFVIFLLLLMMIIIIGAV